VCPGCVLSVPWVCPACTDAAAYYNIMSIRYCAWQ